VAIVLSGLRYTDSDCPFGIFKLFLEVLKILNLKSTDIREITLSPNRQNIKLRISKVSNEVEIARLIDALNDLKQNFPRTIIYCNSITDASKIYTYITSRMFRRHEYVSFKSTAKYKALIITELKDIKSKMGIVIITNAQGMGIVNCYSIVLYGDIVQ
jgi:superfamily II DNA helicase RecQ